jgi:elongation factor G
MNGSSVHSILYFSVDTPTKEAPEVRRAVGEIVQIEPAWRVRVHSVGPQLVICGEDELELQAIREEIQKTQLVVFGELKIGYRETIRKSAEAEGKYIRQTGGMGNYGHCWLRIEPSEPGIDYAFVNGSQVGAIPERYIGPIERGVQNEMGLGILAGYPMFNLKVTLLDGSYHEVDSNEMAFQFAGSIAFKEAARKAYPVLLEPVMAVEVIVSEEFMGTIIDGINARRGRIEEIENEDESGGLKTIKATVPLPELLRSSTYGRPEWTMRFAGYQERPHFGRLGGDDAPAPAIKPRGPRPRTDSAAA